MTANDADDHLPLKIEQEEGANTGFVNGSSTVSFIIFLFVIIRAYK